jgi:hypothetical protein
MTQRYFLLRITQELNLLFHTLFHSQFRPRTADAPEKVRFAQKSYVIEIQCVAGLPFNGTNCLKRSTLPLAFQSALRSSFMHRDLAPSNLLFGEPLNWLPDLGHAITAQTPLPRC